MGSGDQSKNIIPHAVCVPFPAQGHINPMLKLSKLLYSKGFHISFVNTEYNRKRLLRSRGANALDGLPRFRFYSIPDGLPPSDADVTQDVPSVCDSTSRTCYGPFRELVSKLIEESRSGGDVPRVSCIVSDLIMGFTVDVAIELGIPNVMFWTASACGFLGYDSYCYLIDRGLFPLKDESDLTNGFLDTEIDWIPGMDGLRLKNLPTFIRTTDPNDMMVRFAMFVVKNSRRASAVVFNTFDDLEHNVLEPLSTSLPPIYTIGPLQLFEDGQTNEELSSLGSNLWKEEDGCLEWLDSKQSGSVVYVNFGSVTVMSPNQLIEFAWGLANSGVTFLWVIRPDLVNSEPDPFFMERDSVYPSEKNENPNPLHCERENLNILQNPILSDEFVNETKDRGKLMSWCPQEKVLKHKSIGVFLTHNGWNSTIESLCCGVPMICWPFFSEQQTNSWFCVNKWGIGVEIESDVKRDDIERLVREMMGGDKGKALKQKAMDWKSKAEAATSQFGSSYVNFEKMVTRVLLAPPTSNNSIHG